MHQDTTKDASRFRLAFVRECKRLGMPSMEHNSQFLKHVKNGEVYMRCDRVQGREWELFSNAITADNSIYSITLYCEHPSQASQQQQQQQLRGRTPAIQEVGVSLRVCKGLAGCLVSSSVLQKLQFSNIFFTADVLKLISASLPHNSSLQKLSFIGCKIGDDGISALLSGLQSNSSIASLLFNGCNLTDKSAARLAKLIQHHALRRHTTHWMANLRESHSNEEDGNNSDGILSETREWQKETGLTQIILANNCISDKGAVALAEALKLDAWIKEMDLRSNAIGLAGAKALKDALLENDTLGALYLQDNKISDMSVLSEIRSGVAMNVDQKNHIMTMMPHQHEARPASTRESLKQLAAARHDTVPRFTHNSSSDQRIKSHHVNPPSGQHIKSYLANPPSGQHTKPQPAKQAQHKSSELYQDATMHAIEDLRTSLEREQSLRARLEAQIHSLVSENQSVRGSTPYHPDLVPPSHIFPSHHQDSSSSRQSTITPTGQSRIFHNSQLQMIPNKQPLTPYQSPINPNNVPRIIPNITSSYLNHRPPSPSDRKHRPPSPPYLKHRPPSPSPSDRKHRLSSASLSASHIHGSSSGGSRNRDDDDDDDGSDLITLGNLSQRTGMSFFMRAASTPEGRFGYCDGDGDGTQAQVIKGAGSGYQSNGGPSLPLLPRGGGEQENEDEEVLAMLESSLNQFSLILTSLEHHQLSMPQQIQK